MSSETAGGAKTEVGVPSFDAVMAAVGNHPCYTSIQMHFLYEVVKLARGVPGDAVELGVYQGASAVLIAKCLTDRRLWLFDSFSGMMKSDTSVDLHGAGEFCDTSVEAVGKRLAGFENVRFVQGWFPQSIEGRTDLPDVISFAHVDMDLYESTRDAIGFLWPRLSVGGAIVFHDWHWPDCPGVEKAIHEFFSRPEVKSEAREGRYIIAVRKR